MTDTIETELTARQEEVVAAISGRITMALTAASVSVACAESVALYYANGIPPGTFVKCVLQNNLAAAARSGDKGNRALLALWADALLDALPGRAWGSKEAYEQWLKDGGLRGLYIAENEDQARCMAALQPDKPA